MSAVDELERHPITTWAYDQLADMTTGFRNLLDPILPRVESTFDALDAEIARFIIEGRAEIARLDALIEGSTPSFEIQDEQTISFAQIQPSPPDSIVLNGVTYVAQDKKPVEIGMTEEGRLLLDTTGSIDLPNLVVDPRDGGTYTAEIPVIQSVLDIIQEAQDQVPAPIQTTANELYDTLSGSLTNDHRSS